MQIIAFKKRLLYYVALVPISLIFANVCGMIAFVMGEFEGFAEISTLIVFLLLHYLLGVFFLKTKIFRLIIPLLTALISGAILFLLFNYEVYPIQLLVFHSYFDLIIQVFVVAGVWEIACRIVATMIEKNVSLNPQEKEQNRTYHNL
jgi:hypothetical protein